MPHANLPTVLARPRYCDKAADDIALPVNTTEYVGTRMAVTLQVEAKCGRGSDQIADYFAALGATLASARCMGQPAHATQGPMIWET
jgi:hypothetical protein